MAFRSGFEKRVAASLSSRGVTYRYEKDSLPYTKIQRLTKKLREAHGLPLDFKPLTYHMYLIDFIVTTKRGNEIVLETKGRFTSSDRTKMLRVIECNPGKDVRMVFQRDNYLRTGSKKRYSDWCKQHKIKYHVGVAIPQAWLEE